MTLLNDESTAQAIAVLLVEVDARADILAVAGRAC